MATLHDKSEAIKLLLRPYRVEEYGVPTWILIHVEVKQETTVLLATTVSTTRDDLAELRKSLQDVANGYSSGFTINTTDDNLIIEVHRASSAGDFFVGIWVGEPYELMKGYRIAVQGEDLACFSQELREDESMVLPPSRLPS